MEANNLLQNAGHSKIQLGGTAKKKQRIESPPIREGEMDSLFEDTIPRQQRKSRINNAELKRLKQQKQFIELNAKKAFYEQLQIQLDKKIDQINNYNNYL